MIKQALLLVKSLILNLNDLIKIEYWRRKKQPRFENIAFGTIWIGEKNQQN
jgi:hypothetical protein